MLSIDRYEHTYRSCDRMFGFRMPEPYDAPCLWELARASGLDVNSHYAYAMWGEYFADTSLVADAPHDSVPAGFVLGFRPPRVADTLFVWQVAVAEPWRGHGLATAMIDRLVARAATRYVEATVTPSNVASATLFRGLGQHDPDRIDEDLAFAEELFPDGHEAEIRFRVRVRTRPPAPSAQPTQPKPRQD